MFERCLYFNTNALSRKLNSRWDEAFARFNLPPSHGYLLRLVLEQPGLTQQAIAQELRLEKSTVTRFIHSLENKGLLIRTLSNSDQRQRVIMPTQQALDLHRPLADLGDELYASMLKILGQEDLEVFVKLSRKVNDKL